MKRRPALLVAAASLALGVGTALVLDAFYPPALARYQDRSAVVLDRDGEPLRGFTSRDGMWRFPATTADVAPDFLRFLTAYEDKRFRNHPGVDPLAILRASFQWAAAGRPVSGASTLTMQTVRLLEPRPRTLASKIVEMARALQLEWHFDKDRILAMYLTLAPFGGNLEGVTAASRFYFDKHPRWLTPGEAALLVVLPQAPSRLRPDRYPGRARAARDKVLARMETLGVLSSRQGAEARGEGVPTTRRTAPFLAPHLAQRLRSRDPERAVHRTFIERDLQIAVESLARRHLARLEPGVSLALMVVDNDSLTVRAYVGSADFMDAERQGQVDMTRAVRSPGSALKPFIYGAAFDVLNLHPETLVSDRPLRFGDYAPVNFDSRFRGDVTIREALQLSLNVPAVAVLDALGPTRFATLIAGAGPRLRLDSRINRPALPMALGGVGTTLGDLTTLFAGLARGGVAAVPLLTAADPSPAPKRFLSPQAAWYVSEILRGTPPPAARIAARHTGQWRRIALKTGTSYGFRDAWAMGYDGRHTVGVWVGRPDGGFGTDRTGRTKAAPVLFDVFDLLEPPSQDAVAPPPEGVIVARNEDLPTPLRRLRHKTAPLRRAGGPEIAFPPDGVLVELGIGGGDPLPLVVKVRNGTPPFTWIADGVPVVIATRDRQAEFHPEGPGFVDLSVIDATGKSERARVQLR